MRQFVKHSELHWTGWSARVLHPVVQEKWLLCGPYDRYCLVVIHPPGVRTILAVRGLLVLCQVDNVTAADEASQLLCKVVLLTRQVPKIGVETA